MILLYTAPGCASCRKAKQWLKDNGLEFTEKNIFSTILKSDEIKYLLERSENGTEDLISTRSKVFKTMNIDLDEMPVLDLIRFIQANPSVLKRPILLNDKSIVVGYDDDEITAIAPREIDMIAKKNCNESCPNYSVCGAVRNK